jgi:hypothetical protein
VITKCIHFKSWSHVQDRSKCYKNSILLLLSLGLYRDRFLLLSLGCCTCSIHKKSRLLSKTISMRGSTESIIFRTILYTWDGGTKEFDCEGWENAARKKFRSNFCLRSWRRRSMRTTTLRLTQTQHVHRSTN